MIKDIIKTNEDVRPFSKKIEVLKEQFPACFKKDGSFDIELFKSYLSDVNVVNEGYELKYLGKNYGNLLAAEESTTVIVPDEEHNTKPENINSKNIYISGDNLDGLKHLLKSYSHKVKCIYMRRDNINCLCVISSKRHDDSVYYERNDYRNYG